MGHGELGLLGDEDDGKDYDKEEEDKYWDDLFDGVIKPQDGVEQQDSGNDSKGEKQDGDVEEAVAARGIPRPPKPSKREVAEHELTHVPYREWCEHCRKASGRAGLHRCKTEEEKEEIKERAWSTFSFRLHLHYRHWPLATYS